MLTYRISDWTEDPIHIVDHELYDLVHAIKNSDIPTRSYKGVDVYHLTDSESRMLCIRDTQHEHEDFIELIYVRSGSGIASIDGQQYMIQKGDIMFVYPHQAHANLPMPSLCVTNCLLATALVRRRSALFEPCIGQNGTLTFPTIQHLSADTMLQTEQLLDRIAKEANGHLPYYHEAVLYAMNELLLLLKRHEQCSPGRGVQRSLAAGEQGCLEFTLTDNDGFERRAVVYPDGAGNARCSLFGVPLGTTYALLENGVQRATVTLTADEPEQLVRLAP